MNNLNSDKNTKSPSSEKFTNKNSVKEITDSEISSTSHINKSENSILKDYSIEVLTKEENLKKKGERTHRTNLQNNDKVAKRAAFSLSPKKTNEGFLLPKQSGSNSEIKTLVLDLDETLVHSSFDYINNPDIIIPIIIEEVTYEIYVLVRPGTKEFITALSKFYEIVIFTASISEYAEPLISLLDPNNLCKHRLFREHCTYIDGTYVKDLNKMGRHLRNIVIIDNSPISYSFHKNNGIPIKSWYEDKTDRDLIRIIPHLQNLSAFYDIRTEIPKFVINNTIIWNKANEWFEEYNLLNSSILEIQTKILKSIKYLLRLILNTMIFYIYQLVTLFFKKTFEAYNYKSIGSSINDIKIPLNVGLEHQNLKEINKNSSNLTIKSLKYSNTNKEENNENNKIIHNINKNNSSEKIMNLRQKQLKLNNVITQKLRDEFSSLNNNIDPQDYSIKFEENNLNNFHEENENGINLKNKSNIDKICNKSTNKQKDFLNYESSKIDFKNNNSISNIESPVYLETYKSENLSYNVIKENVTIDKKAIAENFSRETNNLNLINQSNNCPSKARKEEINNNINNSILQSKNFLIKENSKIIPNVLLSKNNSKVYNNITNQKNTQVSQRKQIHLNSEGNISKSSVFNIKTENIRILEQKSKNSILQKEKQLKQQNNLKNHYFQENQKTIISNKNKSTINSYFNSYTDSACKYTKNGIKDLDDLTCRKIAQLTENDLFKMKHEIPNINNNSQNFITKLNDSDDYDDTNIMYPQSVLHTDPIENDEDLMEKDTNNCGNTQNPLDLLQDYDNVNLLKNPNTLNDLKHNSNSNININIINGDNNKIFLNENLKINQNLQCNLPNSKTIVNPMHAKNNSNIILENTEYQGPNKNEKTYLKRIISKISSLSDSSDISTKIANKAPNEVENELFRHFLQKNKDEPFKQYQIFDFNDPDNLNKILANNNNNHNNRSEIIYNHSDYDYSADNTNYKNCTQNDCKDNSNSFNHSQNLFKQINSNKLNEKSKYYVEKKIEDLKSILKRENSKSNFINQLTNIDLQNKNIKQNPQMENILENSNINESNFLNIEKEKKSKKITNVMHNYYYNDTLHNPIDQKFLKTDESILKNKNMNFNLLLKNQKLNNFQDKKFVNKNTILNSQSFKLSNKTKYLTQSPIDNKSLNINKIIQNLKDKKQNNNNDLLKSPKKICIESYSQKFKNTNSKKIFNVDNIEMTTNNMNMKNNVPLYNDNSESNIKENIKLFNKNFTTNNFSKFSPSRNIDNTDEILKNEKFEEPIKFSINHQHKNFIPNKKLNESKEINKNKMDLNLKIIKLTKNNKNLNSKINIDNINFYTAYKKVLTNSNNLSNTDKNNKIIPNQKNHSFINKDENNLKNKENQKNSLINSISSFPNITNIESLGNSNMNIPGKNLSRDKKQNLISNDPNYFELTFKNKDEENIESIKNNKSLNFGNRKILENNNISDHLDNLQIKESDSGNTFDQIREKNELALKSSDLNLAIKKNDFGKINENNDNTKNNINKANVLIDSLANDKNRNLLNENFNTNNYKDQEKFDILNAKKIAITNYNNIFSEEKINNIQIPQNKFSSNFIQNNSKLLQNQYKIDNKSKINFNVSVNECQDFNIKADNQGFENKVEIAAKHLPNKTNNNMGIDIHKKNLDKENEDGKNNTFNMYSHYYNLIHKKNNTKSNQLNLSSNPNSEFTNEKNKNYSLNQKNPNCFNNSKKSVVLISDKNNKNNNNNNNHNNYQNYSNINKSENEIRNTNYSHEHSNLYLNTENNNNTYNNNKIFKNSMKKINSIQENLQMKIDVNKQNYNIYENKQVVTPNQINKKSSIKNFSNTFKVKENNISKEEKNIESKLGSIINLKKNTIINLKKDFNINNREFVINKNNADIKKELNICKKSPPRNIQSNNEIFICENPTINFNYISPIHNQDQSNQITVNNLNNKIMQNKSENIKKPFTNSNYPSNNNEARISVSKPLICHNILGNKVILHNSQIGNLNENSQQANLSIKNIQTNNKIYNQNLNSKNCHIDNLQNLSYSKGNNSFINFVFHDKINNRAENVKNVTDISTVETKELNAIDFKDNNFNIVNTYQNICKTKSNYNENKLIKINLSDENNIIYLNSQPNLDYNHSNPKIGTNLIQNKSALNHNKTKTVISNFKINNFKK